MHVCVLNCFSCVWLLVTPCTVAHQTPLSMGFSRREYWSGLPYPPPEDLPKRGIIFIIFLLIWNWWLGPKAESKEVWKTSHFRETCWLSCQCRRRKRCGSNPWVRKIPGEGNGNLLQYSCWENSVERGDWWIAIHRVTKSQTQLNMQTLIIQVKHSQTYE